jgi:acetyl-CoA carboxylase/biotin carboxylase 1
VQIVGDEYGNAIAFNGRDCSTQRRFQKIFEEGPPSIAPKDVFKQMELSAQRLTQSIGYIGAGTVEYLYNAQTNQYYFLELNPRLQVEHPVTEGITGTNLPSIQLQVAMGIPLHRIPDVRAFYGKDRNGDAAIDFMSADPTKSYVYPNKHVIAARITAENPDEGFKPTSGRIERVKFQSAPNVWGYFSVGANGGIHEYADSQFGHLFASGPTREEARKALVLALKEVDIRGDIRTTVEYLIKLLETEEFKKNTIDTSWLDGIIREKSVSVEVDPSMVALSAAIYRAYSSMQVAQGEVVDALNKGQTVISQPLSSLLSFPLEVVYNSVIYPFKVTGRGPNRMMLEINGQKIEVKLRAQPDKSLLCSVNDDQLNLQLFGQVEPLGLRMKVNGQTVMIPTVYNPSELRADVTGKIVRYLQPDGAAINKGDAFVEVEAMKMIMSVKAPESGTITHTLSPGSIISAGDLMATLKLQDPSRVKQLTKFEDRLQSVPQLLSDVPSNADPARERLKLALDGYDYDVAGAIQVLHKAHGGDWKKLSKDILPLLEQFLAVESLFVGQEEGAAINALAKKHKTDLLNLVPALLAHKQVALRSKHLVTILRDVQSWADTIPGYSHDMLPADLKAAMSKIVGLLMPPQDSSHAVAGTTDNSAIVAAQHVSVPQVYSEVAWKTKQIIDASNIPPISERIQALTESLVTALNTAKSGDLYDLRELARQPEIAVNVDLLLTIMTTDSRAEVRRAALEVFIRRVYSSHNIHSLNVHESSDTAAGSPKLSADWTFSVKDSAIATNAKPTVEKKGVLVVVNSGDSKDSSVKSAVDQATGYATALLKDSGAKKAQNELLVAVVDGKKQSLSEQEFATQAADALNAKSQWLHDHGVRSASVFTPAGNLTGSFVINFTENLLDL